MIEVAASVHRFRLRETFTISRGSRDEAEVVTAVASDGTFQGWGECVPYKRYGETVESVLAQIAEMAARIADAPDPLAALQESAPGAARNALDCALWDLKAKATGRPVAELAGLAALAPVTTAFTLSLEDPETMREKARKNAARPLLKIKLGGEGDLERLEAVRAGAPDAAIIVDANEGWSAEGYTALVPDLKRLGVALAANTTWSISSWTRPAD